MCTVNQSYSSITYWVFIQVVLLESHHHKFLVNVLLLIP